VNLGPETNKGLLSFRPQTLDLYGAEAGIEPSSLSLKIKENFKFEIFLPLCVPSLGFSNGTTGTQWVTAQTKNIPGVFFVLLGIQSGQRPTRYVQARGSK
jgi:hypothetical protein